MSQDLIRRLKEVGVLEKKEVPLKHGGISDVYANVRNSYGDPYILSRLAEELWGIMDKDATCIAGSGVGGKPLATAISLYNELVLNNEIKLTLIRDKLKEHGNPRWLEGYVPKDEDKIVLVDDVLTTGKSLRHMINVLEPTGAEILGCYFVVKREEVDLGFPVYYLTTLEKLSQT